MWEKFITEHIAELVMGSITGLIALWCRQINSKLEHKKAEQDALKSGMVAILHDRLFQICNKYLTLGYIPVDEAEQVMDNELIVYNAYSALGGNGTGTDVHNKFRRLHIKKEEE